MILIISDYHKNEDLVLSLIEKYKPTYTLCLGDGESEKDFYEKNNIISVKGNCDYIDLETVKVIDIGGIKILMTHGHLYDVHFDIFKLYLLATSLEVDYVMYGHTHNQSLEKYEGILFINPGALKDGYYALLDDGSVILKKV